MSNRPNSMPEMTAEQGLAAPPARYRGRASANSSARSSAVMPQAAIGGGGFGGFGGFGPTLPVCHYEKRWVDCGSALPGYPVPQCLEWVQICTFPGSSRSLF